MGRRSPIGFWLESYNYPALIKLVLDPLSAHGDGRYQPAWIDPVHDLVLDLEPQSAAAEAVVIVEGLFLHRPRLVDYWDYSIFLDAPFEATVARLATRDRTPADPEHPAMRRYVQGQRLYFSACSPWSRATRVIDNTDPWRPMLRPPGRG